MAGGVVRLGDPNIAGGLVTIAGCDPTVLVNGRPIAFIGGPVGPHAQYTGAALQFKFGSVLVNGKPIATWPSVDTSLYARVTGSLDVIVGGT
jgi:uncharacterized Zn-binding protein involved in type VI secretion